ncbi:TPA: hypothetical protein ACW5QZ_004766, partial [Salmonella enterica]
LCKIHPGMSATPGNSCSEPEPTISNLPSPEKNGALSSIITPPAAILTAFVSATIFAEAL